MGTTSTITLIIYDLALFWSFFSSNVESFVTTEIPLNGRSFNRRRQRDRMFASLGRKRRRRKMVMMEPGMMMAMTRSMNLVVNVMETGTETHGCLESQEIIFITLCLHLCFPLLVICFLATGSALRDDVWKTWLGMEYTRKLQMSDIFDGKRRRVERSPSVRTRTDQISKEFLVIFVTV